MHKDYLLGDYVYGLRSADTAGSMIPPWTLVLGHEHAIRKFASKLVSQEGYKFGEALKKAWKGATIKERHFISPLSLYGKRSVEAPPAPLGGAERPGKGNKKSGKKGGAKGNKAQPHMWQSGKGRPITSPFASATMPKVAASGGSKAADTQGANA